MTRPGAFAALCLLLLAGALGVVGIVLDVSPVKPRRRARSWRVVSATPVLPKHGGGWMIHLVEDSTTGDKHE